MFSRIDQKNNNEEYDSLQLTANSCSVEDMILIQEILEIVRSEISQHPRAKLRLREVFEMLLQGENKQAIARQMGLRPPNITRRMLELKDELLRISTRHDLQELRNLIEREIYY